MGLEGMPIIKGLPYGIFMKKIIYQMTETGQLNQLQKKWFAPEPNCSPLNKEVKSLSWEKMISLFIISIIGIFIALIILIIEKIFHSCNPKRPTSIEEEENKMKLQRFFMKLQETLSLNDDEVFLKSTMSTLIEEIQNYNALLNEVILNTEEVENEGESEDLLTLS